ncbi:MAG: hypothetical protein KDE53_30650, partial [Caldilineaceae bacterium]|nr:hypothetical protein [Caldilineaceae bacterium]
YHRSNDRSSVVTRVLTEKRQCPVINSSTLFLGGEDVVRSAKKAPLGDENGMATVPRERKDP